MSTDAHTTILEAQERALTWANRAESDVRLIRRVLQARIVGSEERMRLVDRSILKRSIDEAIEALVAVGQEMEGF